MDSIAFSTTTSPSRKSLGTCGGFRKDSRQFMILKFFFKRNIVAKFFNEILQFLHRKSSLLATLVRLLEATSPNNFVYHLSKSAHISSMSVYRFVWGFASNSLASSIAAISSVEYRGSSILKGRPRCKTACCKKRENACDMESPRRLNKSVACSFNLESIRKFFATVLMNKCFT